MNHNTQRFFAYVRKSTDEPNRQVQSLDDQKSELASYARQENLQIVKTFEEALTAKVPGRPVFNSMLARIEAGEAHGILAWHPDRLARNAIDGGRIIHSIDSGSLKSLRFPTWWFEPSPQGLFALSMAFGQSKYYIDNLSENIKRSHRQKVARGLWPVNPPFGYFHDRKTKGITPDPELGQAIYQAFRVYARGDATFAELRVRFNRLGIRGRSGRPLSLSQIQYMLTHPVYYGMIRFHGELFEGTHEAIVSKALFDKVQGIMADRGRPRPSQRQYDHPWRGIFRCAECGCSVTTEIQKGHVYLRCTKKKGDCSQPYVREDHITDQITSAVHSLSISERQAEEWQRELDVDERHDRAKHQAEIAQIDQALAANDEQIHRLREAYLSKVLDLEEYAKSKNALMDEKVELKENRKYLQANPGSKLEPTRTLIEASKQARLLASSEDWRSKCVFLAYVGSNLRIRDRKLQFRPRGSWKYVAPSSRKAAEGLRHNRVSGPNRRGFTKRCSQLHSIRTAIRDTPLLTLTPLDNPPGRFLISPSTYPSKPLEGSVADLRLT